MTYKSVCHFLLYIHPLIQKSSQPLYKLHNSSSWWYPMSLNKIRQSLLEAKIFLKSMLSKWWYSVILWIIHLFVALLQEYSSGMQNTPALSNNFKFNFINFHIKWLLHPRHFQISTLSNKFFYTRSFYYSALC